MPLTRSQTKQLYSQQIVNDNLTEHINIFRALHGDFILPPITSEELIQMNRTQFISIILGCINNLKNVQPGNRQAQIFILFDMYQFINAFIKYFIKDKTMEIFFVCTLFCKTLEFEKDFKTKDMSEIDNHLIIKFMSELKITKNLIVLGIDELRRNFYK